MGRLFPVFLILLLALPVFPQLLGGMPKYYTPNEGISSGLITGITQDDQGFIWAATNEGLNRFDGINFTAYYQNLNNPNSPSSNKLSGIEKDIYGKLWIGHLKQPVIDVLDPATLTFKKITIELPVKITSPDINFIFPSAGGKIYVNFWGSSSIVVIDAKKFTTEYIDVPQHPGAAVPDSINYIAETKNSDILIATSDGRIFLYDTKDEKIQLLQDFNEYIILSRSLNGRHNPVYAITASLSGWIFDESKMSFIQIPGSEKYLPQLKDSKFFSLLSDSTGGLLLNNGHSFIASIPAKNNIADFSQISVRKTSLLEVKSIFIDYENNTWLGTLGYGILFLPDKYKKFINFSHAKEYPRKEGVRSLRFILRKNGRTFIAGYDGLQIMDKENRLEKVLYPGKPIRSARFSEWGGKEIIWLGPFSHQKDIFWYDIISGKTGTISLNKLLENSIAYYDIYEDEEFLWFSTNSGIIRLDRTNLSMSYFSHQPENPASLPGNQVRMVRKIQGKYVAEVINHGRWEIDPASGIVKPFLFDGYSGSSLPNEMILTLITDDTGGHWLGTNGEGLYHIDHPNKTITKYTTESGLPNNTIYAILFDKNGDLWGSTNLGIFRFDRKSGLFHNYNKTDGIIENEFNAGASYIDEDGTIFFGGITGYTSFKTEDIRMNLTPPKIALTTLTVNNIDYTQAYRNSPNGRITLPHDSNYIAISFSSLTFSSNQHTRFAYKIEGIHSEYINLENTRILQLNGLDEGIYNISIIGTNSDGVWAEKPLKLIIVITPSFAESWVFYFIIFIIFVLTAITWADWREKRLTRQKEDLENAVKERTLELEQQNKEIADLNHELKTALTVKNKFLSIVAHDLKSPFTALLGYSEILSDDLDKLPKGQVTLMINELGRLSQQTYGLILNLLNWTQLQTNRITLNPVVINLKSAAVHCIDILESNLRKKQITILNSIPEELLAFADKNMVNTIIMNLVNNAYKFSNPGGEIRISAQEKSGKINVSVTDTGIGMTQEKIATLFSEEKSESYSGTQGEKGTGLGLLLIKELLDFAKQSITVKSEPGKGTKITFTLDIYMKESN